MPALPDFCAYPEVRLELSVSDRQIDPLREGVDCVLRIGTLGDDLPLVARRLATLPLVTCASRIPGAPWRAAVAGGAGRTPGGRQPVGHHRQVPFRSLSSMAASSSSACRPAWRSIDGGSFTAAHAPPAWRLIQVPLYHVAQQLATGEFEEIPPTCARRRCRCTCCTPPVASRRPGCVPPSTGPAAVARTPHTMSTEAKSGVSRTRQPFRRLNCIEWLPRAHGRTARLRAARRSRVGRHQPVRLGIQPRHRHTLLPEPSSTASKLRAWAGWPHAAACRRAQLMGSDPACRPENAERLCRPARRPASTSNFGCPAGSSTATVAAPLCRSPSCCTGIVSGCAARRSPQACRSRPRCGWASTTTVKPKPALAITGGADQLVVEPAPRRFPRPPAWSRIADICQVVRLPAVANGEIWAWTMRAAASESGCSDLMGRGMVADPGLALAIPGRPGPGSRPNRYRLGQPAAPTRPLPRQLVRARIGRAPTGRIEAVAQLHARLPLQRRSRHQSLRTVNANSRSTPGCTGRRGRVGRAQRRLSQVGNSRPVVSCCSSSLPGLLQKA